jgi:mannose-6-phosphate isomerase-like protein (cupin superfamily)
MKNLRIAVVFIIFTASAPAFAQVTFKRITGEDAARAVRGNSLNSTFAEGQAFSMSIHKRTESGHVERHMDWDEAFMIQDGDELLKFGKTASNPRQESPGEFSGGTITDGKSVMLHAGDIVTMPAGMWHQHVLKTPTVRYVLIKTRKSGG